MKNKLKKLIALMLSLVMIISCVPANIVSAETPGKVTVTFLPNTGQGRFVGKFNNNPNIKLGKSFEDEWMTEKVYDTIGSLHGIYDNKTVNTNFYGTTIDFTEIDSEEEVQSLIGCGFSVTCQTCEAFVCLKFVEGTGIAFKPVDGINFGDNVPDTHKENKSVVCEIGVTGLTTGKEIITRFMTKANEFNEKMYDLYAGTKTPIDMSEYGIPGYTQTSATQLNSPYQISDNGNGNYLFTDGWAWVLDGSKNLTKNIERHYIMIGAEYNAGEYGTILYVTDPRANGKINGCTNGSKEYAYSKEEGAVYKMAVKQGIYMKAENLLNTVEVEPGTPVSELPPCPYASPDGRKVFIGWSTDTTKENILDNDETIDDDTTLYAIWDTLTITEQPTKENNYTIKTNVNPLWELANDVKIALKEYDYSASKWNDADISDFDNGGRFAVCASYGLSEVYSDPLIFLNVDVTIPYTEEELLKINDTGVDNIKGPKQEASRVDKIEKTEAIPEFDEFVGKYWLKISGSYLSESELDHIERVTFNGVDITEESLAKYYSDAEMSDFIADLKSHNCLAWVKDPTHSKTYIYYFTSLAHKSKKKKELTPEQKVVKEIEKNVVKQASSNEGNKINPDAKFINGYEDGTFKPNQSVNNLELMCMITQLFEDTSSLGYDSIDLNQGENEWAGDICAKANSLGLIPGDKDDKDYNLYGDVTRADLAVVIYNLIKDYTKAPSLSDRDNCNDAIGKPYEEAVAKLVSLGILKGFDDGLFHGESTLTRAEAVVIINRTLQSLGFEIKLNNIDLTFLDLDETHWAYSEIMYAANK